MHKSSPEYRPIPYKALNEKKKKPFKCPSVAAGGAIDRLTCTPTNIFFITFYLFFRGPLKLRQSFGRIYFNKNEE